MVQQDTKKTCNSIQYLYKILGQYFSGTKYKHLKHILEKFLPICKGKKFISFRYQESEGGRRKFKITRKSVRKHRGIIQSGGNSGRLRKGYKYTGRRLKNGKAEIVKVTKK